MRQLKLNVTGVTMSSQISHLKCFNVDYGDEYEIQTSYTNMYIPIVFFLFPCTTV